MNIVYNHKKGYASYCSNEGKKKRNDTIEFPIEILKFDFH
jgi:hypothetical protein